MQQIAVRGMKLNAVKACGCRTRCSRGEIGNDADDVLFGHHPRRGRAGKVGARGGSNEFKPAFFGREHALSARRIVATALAAGVRELNKELRTRGHRTAVVHELCERLLLGVVVEPEAPRGDAPFGGDGRCLHHDEPCTRIHQPPVVHRVPGARKTVVGATLAHRRHADAVFDGRVLNRDRGEQKRTHGSGSVRGG